MAIKPKQPKFIVRAYYPLMVYQSGFLDIGVYDEELDLNNIDQIIKKAKLLAAKHQSNFLSNQDYMTIDRIHMGTPELSIVPVDEDGEPIDEEEIKI